MVTVLVNGACGRMGRAVLKAVQEAEDLQLVGAVDIAGGAILMPDYLNNESLGKAVRVIFWALAVLTVLSRLLSGVHWLTDIIGGIIISAFFLTLYYAAYRKIDYMERKQR